jgi:hypothetical protein
MLEVGVFLPTEELLALEDQRRYPGGPLVEAERELEKSVELAAALHGPYLD